MRGTEKQSIVIKSSKDDNDTPSFVPEKCPICFEWVWDDEQLMKCSECGGKVCAVCCHIMRIRTKNSARKGVSCPLCRTERFISPADVEAPALSPDRELLLPDGHPRRGRGTDRRSEGLMCTVKNGARATVAACIAMFIYLATHSQ
jgi:hypothetical protein